ncbi:eCIS core domain-containing protein [Almyronema epifaneia]|uniref:DUF4157 domain-containing protein n=1 Tax=Almyronema epifaneia S1 TaxID=2991925 RepID=A0ABW6IH11_9CYAN
MRSKAPPITAPPTLTLPTAPLQRRCACATAAKSGANCRHPPAAAIPPIVHEVLRSPGQPLPPRDRLEMSTRLGTDLHQVRLHTDTKAQQSALAVNALAYTVGSHIVFAPGQYSTSAASQQLLAHELVHVLQQGQQNRPPQSVAHLSSAGDRYEQEADRIGQRWQTSPPTLTPSHQPLLMRRLRVDRPSQPIPTPDAAGRQPTNAETVETYLRTLSAGGNPRVDRTSGEVSLDTGFCPGALGGLIQGARAGYELGNTIGSVGGRVPLLGPIVGAIGGFFGAIGGFFAGLFGAQSPSPAAASSTPTGSTCLCDFVGFSNTWTIEINDEQRPVQGHQRVIVPSPNSRRVWGSATVGGALEENPPWLILGHELCGHAWLDERDQAEGDLENQAPGIERETTTGATSIIPLGRFNPESGALETVVERPQAGQYLRHSRTVERENLIRQEHNLDPRGFRLRDPYCGESFWRERGADSSAPPHWQQSGQGEYRGFETYLEVCEALRRQLPENRDGRYRIDQRIP